MNQAMGKLAEKLGIDHAKMPREELAEVVCEKALKRIAQLEELHADLLHAFEETPEVFADTVWCRNQFTTLYEAALHCRLDMIEKPDIHKQVELNLNTPWTKVSDLLPPSGSTVLLKQKHDGCDPFVIVGQYAEKHTIESHGDDDEVDYSEEKDTYYCPEGFYERQMNWDEYQWIAIDSSMPVIEWTPIPGEEQ